MDNCHHCASNHDKNLIEVMDEVLKSVCLGRNCLSLTKSCDELGRPMISLYPSEVIDFSSQYGPERSISYTINNIIGPPQIFPRYGDFTQSAVLRTYGNWWKKLRPTKVRRSRGSFISEDFITLSFPDFVEPSMIQLTETYNPGALVKIMAAEIRNEKIFRWVVLWEATELSSKSCRNKARIFCPKFIRECHFYTNIIRLEFNSSNLPYYTEIDSVELFGHAKKKEEDDDDDVIKEKHVRCIVRISKLNNGERE
ncbi:hypothetical protein HELRODRAFT_173356 [Helobdella robusta]|uniref:F5/8 type C domain-containing protein n=1 Tax=Helobdella robusta TaxID=6412 RepID=T1F6Q2_HELRO|nr:hypothetical protein HELRODRAFT_173356 [Helobdella robusta]ESO03659.1 hypothetical protein HELRODRAFT_173356 [Helobdella robusta]